MRVRTVFAAVSVLLLLRALGALPALADTANGSATGSLQGHRHARVCGTPAAHHASCHAIIDLDVAGPLAAAATPTGYGPADLQKAYNLPSATAGSGRTVAIVDAYDLPTAQNDLNAYRAQYGLPPCASGCFTKVNQRGGATPPAANAAWGQEIALDLDMVSAACPNCKILLVEADSASIDDLGTAVNTAVGWGAVAVSNSYGGSESSNDASYDSSYYNHPGVAITVSSGDSGYGVQYPAASQYVTAVGGTALTRSSTARGFTETAWSGAGSGCSAYDPKPSWQHDTGCARRTVADVAAVADPNTGVAVYDSTPSGGQSGWLVFGGTSAAAPLVAATYALAGTPAVGSAPASFPYANSGGLYDVTSGSNGSCGAYLCTAGAGYDGPTGLGTPHDSAAFSAPPIAVYYGQLGGASSYLGAPVGDEYAVTGGSAQNYQYGMIYYSPATGAHAVHGAILSRYLALGGPAGLGFPTTDESPAANGGRYNNFEYGAITWSPTAGAHETHGAIRAHWAALGYESGLLGFPTTDESPAANGGRYNNFEYGAITWSPTAGAHETHGAIRARWAALGYESGPLGFPTSDEYPVPGGTAQNYEHGTLTWNQATGQVTVVLQ